ncbi:MAG: galactokinase [Akkermansia sp.]|nr:galactokinase [Akkermansia sp.]MBR5875306.1 galactokinase [Akkermansia sp.]
MDLEQREISVETISPYFEEYFGQKPTVVAASPGRVNLIGEHTDYNNGFVLPMALNNINVVAVAPSPTGKHRWIGALGDTMIQIDPADATKPGDPFWSNYVRGVICMLERRGIKVPAVDMLIDSNVPRGGGLSSSAAFEVATCTALAALCGADVTPTERALIGQATEHEFVNVPCGIMDQFISANGKQDHALMLDCKDLTYKLIPMTDPNVSVLVIDSAVKHSLADGGYAARRKNCEDACVVLGVPSLREATLEMLEEKKEALGDLCYRRARHVIGENLRVEKFAAAVAAADWDAAGVAMRASHASLKNDFEVSCAEVDTLVSLADSIPSAASVYGARMTGGGFGGCIVALVKSSDVEKVAEEMLEAYRNELGIETTYLVTRPGEGARVLYKA